MKIGVLTSSRADFGIYLPLLQAMQHDSFFEIEIIAFGTHTSPHHGQTVREIDEQGFTTVHTLHTLVSEHDDPAGIAQNFAHTCTKFVSFWQQHPFDWVFCLGDRYEMSAAVQAGIPFGQRYIHFHGGETTLGAIDNTYRDQITAAAHVHFTSNHFHSERVKVLKPFDHHIYNIGSLSLAAISQYPFTPEDEFLNRFKIQKPYILITVHPETVAFAQNEQFASELMKALHVLVNAYFLTITLPNADTMGSVYREAFLHFAQQHPTRVLCIESFGKHHYFNAMKYAAFLLGNTSSGIIEAASFGKYALNIGQRQFGRLASENVVHCPFNAAEILEKATEIGAKGAYIGTNIYENPDAVSNAIHHLKQLAHETL